MNFKVPLITHLTLLNLELLVEVYRENGLQPCVFSKTIPHADRRFTLLGVKIFGSFFTERVSSSRVSARQTRVYLLAFPVPIPVLLASLVRVYFQIVSSVVHFSVDSFKTNPAIETFQKYT